MGNVVPLCDVDLGFTAQGDGGEDVLVPVVELGQSVMPGFGEGLEIGEQIVVHA